jgi:hypothetical protein
VGNTQADSRRFPSDSRHSPVEILETKADISIRRVSGGSQQTQGAQRGGLTHPGGPLCYLRGPMNWPPGIFPLAEGRARSLTNV